MIEDAITGLHRLAAPAQDPSPGPDPRNPD
jgi:hypothetical protein